MTTKPHESSPEPQVTAEQVTKDYEAGLNDPTDEDRDVSVMAERFAKMGLSKEKFAEICEQAKKNAAD